MRWHTFLALSYEREQDIAKRLFSRFSLVDARGCNFESRYNNVIIYNPIDFFESTANNVSHEIFTLHINFYRNELETKPYEETFLGVLDGNLQKNIHAWKLLEFNDFKQPSTDVKIPKSTIIPESILNIIEISQKNVKSNGVLDLNLDGKVLYYTGDRLEELVNTLLKVPEFDTMILHLCHNGLNLSVLPRELLSSLFDHFDLVDLRYNGSAHEEVLYLYSNVLLYTPLDMIERIIPLDRDSLDYHLNYYAQMIQAMSNKTMPNLTYPQIFGASNRLEEQLQALAKIVENSDVFLAKKREEWQQEKSKERAILEKIDW